MEKKKKKTLLTYIHHFNNKSHMLSEACLLSLMQRLLNVETEKNGDQGWLWVLVLRIASEKYCWVEEGEIGYRQCNCLPINISFET